MQDSFSPFLLTLLNNLSNSFPVSDLCHENSPPHCHVPFFLTPVFHCVLSAGDETVNAVFCEEGGAGGKM